MLYSGSQTQRGNLQTVPRSLHPFTQSGTASDQTIRGIILGWYFTRGDFDHKSLKSILGFLKGPTAETLSHKALVS